MAIEKTRIDKHSPLFSYLLSVWPIVMLALLTPFALPSILVGHPWKAELVLSIILSSIILYIFIRRPRIETSLGLSSEPVRSIVLPIIAFVLWSGISLIWANSTESVIHHTLVWSIYLLFFLSALYIVSSDRLLRLSFFSLAAAVSIIGIVCIIEYLLRDTIDVTFAFRYARYAEVWATLLPVFFSFALRLKGNHVIWAAFVISILWLGVLFSSSRGALIAALAGLAVFGILRLFANKKRNDRKKLLFAASFLLLLGILTQLPTLIASNDRKVSTLTRMATSSESDPANSISQNVRFLFWAVGLEIIKTHPVIGIGADNYGLEFNNYREKLSSNPENRLYVQNSEDAIPERAHNEYLQIVSELGIVGGIIFLALLYGILKVGFTEIKNGAASSANILSHAAIGGMVAFLVSSAVSSFSFRLVQNGVVFIFLLALLLRNSVKRTRLIAKQPTVLSRPNLAFLSIGLLLCIGMFAFSSLKAASLYLTSEAEHEQNFEKAQSTFVKAIELDKANSAAYFSYGITLLNNKSYSKAAVELSKAIRNGIATSTAYSYLISSHSLASENEMANAVAADSVNHYPYSTFLRVRYGVLLDESGLTEEANAQFEIAQSIDASQSQTWKLFITQGPYRAADAGRAGIGVAKMSDLLPRDAVYAVMAERNIRFPHEKFVLPPQ